MLLIVVVSVLRIVVLVSVDIDSCIRIYAIISSSVGIIRRRIRRRCG